MPEGLLRLAPGFVRGEALVAGALAPAPLHLRIGGPSRPRAAATCHRTWRASQRRLSVRPPGRSTRRAAASASTTIAPAISTIRAEREPNDEATPAKNSAEAISSVVRM